MFERIINFTRKSYYVAKTNIKTLVKGVATHTESIAILTMASVGGSYMFATLPLYYTVPIWVNVSMIAPVLSVAVVLSLVKVAELREIHSVRVSQNIYPV